MKKHLFSFIAAICLLLPASAAARIDEGTSGFCATHPSGLTESLARHAAHQRQLDRAARTAGVGGAELYALGSAAGPAVTRNGDIAIIEDDGSILIQPNPFDVSKSIKFIRKKKGFKIKSIGSSVSANLGERVSLGDDDSVEFDLPDGLKIRYFGQKYSKIFINSDGNITFEEAEGSSSPRDLGRVINGPPRISGFFADLDPSTTSGDTGVFVRASKTKVVVTWVGVPEFNRSSPNTFQITLFKRGNVILSYGEMSTETGVVGLAPGRGRDIELVDFSDELPLGPLPSAAAEQFGTEDSFDEPSLAAAFLNSFKDQYSHLIVFYNFPRDLDGAFAYHRNLRNKIDGIGRPNFDASGVYGSDGVLESFVNMGFAGKYNGSPDDFVARNLTAAALLGHEVGHRWLAFADFEDANGQPSSDLGEGTGHWNFGVDNGQSCVGGNALQDNGDGTFTSLDVPATYGFLDLYLMGMIKPGQVPPFFYVDDRVGGLSTPENSRAGVTFSGNRVDLTVNDVIAVEGPRSPKANKAPKDFNMAFVILTRAGSPVSPSRVDAIDRLRVRWESWFAEHTDGEGSANTALKEK